jgi:hypothetical protein
MKSHKFPIPEGMVPPDGVTEGSSFDALATLRLEADGLTLLAIDGLPIEGAAEEAPEPEADAATAEEMGFEEAVRAGMTE